MYSEEAIFYHPLFVVKGKENIFGAHMFWASINRKTDARVKRIGIDASQAYAPLIAGCVQLVNSTNTP